MAMSCARWFSMTRAEEGIAGASSCRFGDRPVSERAEGREEWSERGARMQNASRKPIRSERWCGHGQSLSPWGNGHNESSLRESEIPLKMVDTVVRYVFISRWAMAREKEEGSNALLRRRVEA